MISLISLIVLKILGYIYFQDQGGVLSPAQSGAITASVSVGVIIGTILFGFFGDAFGRHSVYGRELILTIIGDLMSVLLPWKGFSKQSIVAWMAVSRVFVGFGTGGGESQSPLIYNKSNACRFSNFCCPVCREGRKQRPYHLILVNLLSQCHGKCRCISYVSHLIGRL